MEYQVTLRVESGCIQGSLTDWARKIVQHAVDKSRLSDIRNFRLTLFENNRNIMFPIEPIGTNVKISMSTEYDMGESIEYSTVSITCSSKVNYRSLNDYFCAFLTSLFRNLEESVVLYRYSSQPKKYVAKILAVEGDSSIFKKVFTKSIDEDLVDHFSVQRQMPNYTISASEKNVYILSSERDDIINKSKNLIYRLVI